MRHLLIFLVVQTAAIAAEMPGVVIDQDRLARIKAAKMPAFDCAANRWVTLELKYTATKRSDRTDRDFPHGRSCGIAYDPKRKLIWGTDTNSQIYVLRLDASAANVKPLE